MIARSNTRVASGIRQPNTVQFMGTWRNKGNASCFSSSGPSNHLCVIALRVLSNDDDYVARISIMHDECLLGTACTALSSSVLGRFPLINRHEQQHYGSTLTNTRTLSSFLPGLGFELQSCCLSHLLRDTIVISMYMYYFRSQIGRCSIIRFFKKSVL